MSFNLSPIAKHQFLDESGNPLVAGKLYTYIAGSVTPTATYTDVTGTTENTSPIILDSRGECNLWLDSTIAYKFILKDSNDVLIWSVDNITVEGSGSGTVSWSSITGKPTTFPPSAHNQSWTTISSTPTTIAGYAITDAYTKSEVNTIANNLQSQINNNSTDIDVLTSAVININTDLNQINSNITDLQNTDISLQNQINGVTSAINSLEDSVLNINNDINAIETNVSTLSGDVADLIDDQYKTIVTSADSSPDYLYSKITSKNESIIISDEGDSVGFEFTGKIPSDSSDTTTSAWGTLFDKLVAGSNTTLDVVTCAGIRKVQINAITSGIEPVLGDHKVMASLTDPSYGTLVEKLCDIEGNAFSVVTCAGVQKVQIEADTYKVKATSATNEGYLDVVLDAGEGVTLTTSGDKIVISSEGTSKVKVNSLDTSASYLKDKIQDSDSVKSEVVGNSVLSLNVDKGVNVDNEDFTNSDQGYLEDKLVAGTGIAINKVTTLNGNALELSLNTSGYEIDAVKMTSTACITNSGTGDYFIGNNGGWSSYIPFTESFDEQNVLDLDSGEYGPSNGYAVFNIIFRYRSQIVSTFDNVIGILALQGYNGSWSNIDIVRVSSYEYPMWNEITLTSLVDSSTYSKFRFNWSQIAGCPSLRIEPTVFGFLINQNIAALIGTGTPNKISKWDSNGNRLTDSALYSDSGNNIFTRNTTLSASNYDNAILTPNNSLHNVTNTLVGGGDGNVLDGINDATVLGNENIMGTGSRSHILGNNNESQSYEAVIIGTNNTDTEAGGANTTVGHANSTLGSSNSTILGSENINLGSGDGVTVGRANQALNSSDSVIVGKENIVSALATMVFGKELNIQSSATYADVHLGTDKESGVVQIHGQLVDKNGTYSDEGLFITFDTDGSIVFTSAVNTGSFVHTSGDTMTGQLNVPSVSANYVMINTEASFTSEFNTSAGTLSWNSDDKTLNIGLENGSVLQAGQEEIVYAVNQTGSTINNGDVVKIAGSSGNRVVVEFAQATTDGLIAFYTLATQTIENNQSGYFTRFGLVRDIDTSDWNEGDTVFLSTSAGKLTNIQPDKEYCQVPCGIVTRSHAVVGTIMVNPMPIPRLKCLTDVEQYTSATEGNYLAFNNGLWRPRGNFYQFEDVASKFYTSVEPNSANWQTTYVTVSANSATWGSGGESDGKVKVTSGDTADYLGTKLVEGTGMTISVETSAVTFTVDPPQDALQTFPIALATGQGGTFDGAYSHITGLYVPYNTTIDTMSCYVTQTGSNNLYLAVYDKDLNLLCQTSAFSPSATGVISAPLISACSLTKNQRYYFFVGGNANGCQLLQASGLYASNEPFLAKIDDNASTPPSIFGGSSSSVRYWLNGYKS